MSYLHAVDLIAWQRTATMSAAFLLSESFSTWIVSRTPSKMKHTKPFAFIEKQTDQANFTATVSGVAVVIMTGEI